MSVKTATVKTAAAPAKAAKTKSAAATPAAALVPTTPSAPAAPTAPVLEPVAASYDLGLPKDVDTVSTQLKKFVDDNNLTTSVQGKEFVNVEGWQFAGSRFAIVPIVEHVINVSTDVEIKYQAKVTLYDLKRQCTVGAGFAVCSNKESGKKFYQEFAIMSMAQTRATGKAFRNVLAWVMRAAGYEATPAEEMDYNTNATEVPVMVAQPGGPAPEAPALPAPPVVYATAAQKEEIIRLLDHEVITRQEKTKMLMNINRLDEERATAAINKLKTAIDERVNLTNLP